MTLRYLPEHAQAATHAVELAQREAGTACELFFGTVNAVAQEVTRLLASKT